MTDTTLTAAPTPTSLEMRASVLREPGRPPAVESVWLDPPGPGEVRVRVAAAGVCHSDVHLADGELGEGRWPMVLGHEGAGVIEALGAGVTAVSVGEHVVFCLVAPCGVCEACRSGHRTLCGPAGAESVAGNLPTGARRLHAADGASLQHGLTIACFAEHAVVSADSVIPIPADVPLWQAALLGCGVITGFGAVTHAAGARIGARVAVIGCGGVGLSAVNGAALAGAERIIAIDTVPSKLELARELGATDTINASNADPVEQVRDLTKGGVHYSFEALGLKRTAEQAFEMLRPGGTATIIGMVPFGMKIELHGFDFLRDRKIQGTSMGGNRFRVDMPRLLSLWRQGRLKLDHLISGRLRLDHINEGFAALKSAAPVRQLIDYDA
jgi:S-(hydroxymethyl)glutathione dehydrogenase / alcohol dehydrogenase